MNLSYSPISLSKYICKRSSLMMPISRRTTCTTRTYQSTHRNISSSIQQTGKQISSIRYPTRNTLSSVHSTPLNPPINRSLSTLSHYNNTLPNLQLFTNALEHLDSTAIIDSATNQSYTYKQLLDDSLTVRNNLLSL